MSHTHKPPCRGHDIPKVFAVRVRRLVEEETTIRTMANTAEEAAETVWHRIEAGDDFRCDDWNVLDEGEPAVIGAAEEEGCRE